MGKKKLPNRDFLGFLSCSILWSHPASCPAAAVEGQWLEWGPWSACSVTCNMGSQQRQRRCSSSVHGWAECKGPHQESRECSNPSCNGECRCRAAFRGGLESVQSSGWVCSNQDPAKGQNQNHIKQDICLGLDVPVCRSALQILHEFNKVKQSINTVKETICNFVTILIVYRNNTWVLKLLGHQVFCRKAIIIIIIKNISGQFAPINTYYSLDVEENKCCSNKYEQTFIKTS